MRIQAWRLTYRLRERVGKKSLFSSHFTYSELRVSESRVRPRLRFTVKMIRLLGLRTSYIPCLRKKRLILFDVYIKGQTISYEFLSVFTGNYPQYNVQKNLNLVSSFFFFLFKEKKCQQWKGFACFFHWLFVIVFQVLADSTVHGDPVH